MIVGSRYAILWHFETDDIVFAIRNAPRRVVRINSSAQPIILNSIHLSRFLLLAHLIQSFRTAKTGVCISIIDEYLRVLLINLAALSLPVRAMLPPMKWAFIGRNTHPL